MKRWSSLLLVVLALAMTSCVFVRARDLSDLGLSEGKVTCSSTDGKVHCACRGKCVSEANDCRCDDDD
jgi:hypothetical protein